MKKVDVLLGLQWGDEGKGKTVDVLTPNYDMVARFQGGPNAGHTLEFDEQKYVLRSIPSGIFQGDKVNLIGNGVVLDPITFKDEIDNLMASGKDIKNRIVISRKAHLILPTHRLIDAAQEMSKGDKKVGTTGKGIGPTYTDKVSRVGMRVGDIEENFEQKYAAIRERHLNVLANFGMSTEGLEESEKQLFDAIDFLRSMTLVNSEYMINEYLTKDQGVLAEGAQGSLLDIDFGSYPFVTSSNTCCAGCCTGLGVAPGNIGNVYGIFKAYCTRVGAGPFPTELFDETGKQLAELGHEFGSVTGRARRCGWIDLVALKYTVMLNGVTHLIMMKADVLDTFDTIQACVGYKVNGQETSELPFDIASSNIEPIYKEFKGWKQDLTQIREESQFPQELSDYIRFIEEYLGAPIYLVSVGPDREQTIIRG